VLATYCLLSTLSLILLPACLLVCLQERKPAMYVHEAHSVLIRQPPRAARAPNTPYVRRELLCPRQATGHLPFAPTRPTGELPSRGSCFFYAQTFPYDIWGILPPPPFYHMVAAGSSHSPILTLGRHPIQGQQAVCQLLRAVGRQTFCWCLVRPWQEKCATPASVSMLQVPLPPRMQPTPQRRCTARVPGKPPKQHH
jgi:hypothetical protein